MPEPSESPPMRMSPNRESPCWPPAVPKAEPSSETCTRLMLATDSQVAAALSMADCHCATVIPFAAIEENRALESPPMFVPSGAKL